MFTVRKAGVEIVDTTRSDLGDHTSRTLAVNLPQPEWYAYCLDDEGNRQPYSGISVNPNYDSEGDAGMVEWSINIEPFRVPGILELAWYTAGESGLVFDHVDVYTLDQGSMSTGPLPVGTYVDGEVQWAGVAMLFWPSYMTAARPAL